MREIKFRAFVRGYMVNVVSIDFVNKYITWDDNQFDRCLPPNKLLEMESFEDIKLMQFTGLTDCNGVEIYEGDIIDYGNNRFMLVEFIKGTFCICKNTAMPTLMTLYHIVGNIYTTPELLTKTK